VDYTPKTGTVALVLILVDRYSTTKNAFLRIEKDWFYMPLKKLILSVFVSADFEQ
jgi:hypothetical protein